MSNKASSVSNHIGWKPDNPQETLNEENYYYAGFFAGEMTCSVIKAANYNPVGHYYFAIDITVTNADRALLESINKAVMQKSGVISPVKGAFNLSARGKKRVETVLTFLGKYPIIAGDCARNRIALMQEALAYLKEHRGSSAHQAKSEVMETIRTKLRTIKESGKALQSFPCINVSTCAAGYFLAGILDGEGSFGIKKSGKYSQPFVAVAMKDQKILELFQTFLQYGKIRRRKDGLFHYELNHREVLSYVTSLFLTKYPLRHARQRARMQALQRILNDYTQN